MLLLTALIWGVAFVAQSVGMDYIGPFTFNSVRSLLGGFVLLPVIGVVTARQKKHGNDKTVYNKKTLIIGGICCGLALAAASGIQQVGISMTTVGKAGFITALYILIVPILGIFLKKKAGVKLWVSVAIALVGLYMLCMSGALTINTGDILIMVCAVIFAVHILTIDYFSSKVDCVKMACIQFFVCGLVSMIPAFAVDGPIFHKTPELGAIAGAWLPIVYAGVLSCGVAYTLQIVAQKNTEPTVASLILSLESVFAVLAGWIILGQKLSSREIIGCVLMFGAIILAQLPSKREQEKTNETNINLSGEV